MTPKVSIITVVFNNKDYLENAIISVMNQSHREIEHILIDGGSTDGSVEVIKKYHDRIDKWISEPDSGIYDAMNKGIAMASGEIVGFLNSDDTLFDRNTIKTIVNAFTPDVDCIYGNLVYVKRDCGTTITRRWISCEFQEGLFEKSWTPPHPTFYCRRSAYKKFKNFRLDFQIASDVELMYRFLQNHKLKSKYIDSFLVKMRSHGVSNRGLKSTIIITREMKQAIQENGGHFNTLKYLFYKFLKIRQLLFKKV